MLIVEVEVEEDDLAVDPEAEGVGADLQVSEESAALVVGHVAVTMSEDQGVIAAKGQTVGAVSGQLVANGQTARTVSGQIVVNGQTAVRRLHAVDLVAKFIIYYQRHCL